MVDVKKRRLQWSKNQEKSRLKFGEREGADSKLTYKPVEVTTSPGHYEITAELASQINTELASYSRDGNALCLWKVLAICLESDIPVPGTARKFFFEISQKLIQFARDGVKQARESVSDLALGTINEDGGRGVFRSFVSAEKERGIVRRAENIILQQIAGELPRHESLEAVYETVATEFDVQPEHVKKLIQLYEADAGSFGFRELLDAVTGSPQVFASGLDTTVVTPGGQVHSEEPSD
jgi:hypothetical protein